MPRLSVALITFNEERNLAACLRSVAFADEIVIVDNASSDRTQEIAREFGARVLEVADWPGFGPQKNRAIAACTGDWILALDADERVEEPLRAEIEQVLERAAFDVYALPRRSTYCGRYIRHGGWWPDYVSRLFRRGAARYSESRVHERLVTDRPVGRLDAPLTHFSFRTMEQVLAKMNHYSSEGAHMLAARGRAPGLASAIGHGLAAFVRTYVLRLGFLDGRFGFLLAVSNAEGSYYRYVKAMLAAETRRDDVE
jgi:glycosyltransferase involved in cell wall biosynthesis